MKRGAVAASLVLALCAGAAAASDAAPLRVCADPDNLPFSRADGSGFENRIAQLAAQDLHRPLAYAWLPDRRAFVRKTMGAGLCDVIMGVPAASGRTANTRPYYRSTYVWVERARDAMPTSFDDARLARVRIGVQLIGNDMAASPPGAALAGRGLVRNVVGFPVVGERPSAQRMVDALAAGAIDAALVWGPQAGWFAARSRVPLRVAAAAAPADLKGQQFEFAIAMGVRRGDEALRHALDGFIVRRHADIARILADYSVPVVAGASR